MRRETDEFLELVRDAQDPTPADEARVLSALKATLAAGVTSNAIVAATLARPRSGATVGAVGSKLIVVVACAAAAVFGSGDTTIISGSQAPQPTSSPRLLPPAVPAREVVPEAVVPAPPRPAPGASRTTPREKPAGSPVRRPSAGNTPRAEVPRGNALRAELELLQRVQLALRQGDGEAALRALDAHATDDRILLPERAAARILALCSMGRVAEARRAALRFEKEHPESVQRDAIARSCANL
jgi:RNA polymerase sigma-70 factor (ECF subfamily)